MTHSADFVLHPQLQRDTFHIAESPLCRVLWMNDARYPWALLVPRVPGATEIIDLDEPQQSMLCRESAQLSQALKAGFHGGKMNIAALGNLVPQLHLHHVLRAPDDEAWPQPVWGHGTAVAYSQALLQERLQRLRPHLPPTWVRH